MLMRTVLMAPVALAVATMRPEPVVTLDHPPPEASVQAVPPDEPVDIELSEVAAVKAEPEPVEAPTEPSKVKSEPAALAGTAPPKDEQPAEETAKAVKHHSKAFDRSLRCLAMNVYHEARSQSDTGQKAVAAVTLNRVASSSFPDTVCGVVEQGGQRLHHCQFSWWCDGRNDKPTETKAWEKALRISRLTLDGDYNDPTGGALFYHTTSVHPKWSRHFKRTARIGDHIFYKPVKRPTLRLAGLE
jgi:N-acetylmuramoyl-L-alanine amidase